jgi:hypothetical protein
METLSCEKNMKYQVGDVVIAIIGQEERIAIVAETRTWDNKYDYRLIVCGSIYEYWVFERYIKQKI